MDATVTPGGEVTVAVQLGGGDVIAMRWVARDQARSAGQSDEISAANLQRCRGRDDEAWLRVTAPARPGCFELQVASKGIGGALVAIANRVFTVAA